MEPTMSLQAATVLLGAGALGGLVMAGMRLKGEARPPSWLAMVHGVLAAAALTLLIYAALTVGIPTLALYALGLLVIAAIGGAAINLLYHSKMLPLSIPLIIVHASLRRAFRAVAGERFRACAGRIERPQEQTAVLREKLTTGGR